MKLRRVLSTRLLYTQGKLLPKRLKTVPFQWFLPIITLRVRWNPVRKIWPLRGCSVLREESSRYPFWTMSLWGRGAFRVFAGLNRSCLRKLSSRFRHRVYKITDITKMLQMVCCVIFIAISKKKSIFLLLF